MCIIGHRSGFIEGAAFVGIPVFYIHNELKNFAQPSDKPGQYLWKPIKNPTHDRPRELADVVDTFIPVECLRNEPTKPVLDEDGNQVFDENGKERKIFQVDEDHRHDLSAALYMFMCGAVPAWTTRVASMHDVGRQEWLHKRFDAANAVSDALLPK